jgi:hypothetical protein
LALLAKERSARETRGSLVRRPSHSSHATCRWVAFACRRHGTVGSPGEPHHGQCEGYERVFDLVVQGVGVSQCDSARQSPANPDRPLFNHGALDQNKKLRARQQRDLRPPRIAGDAQRKLLGKRTESSFQFECAGGSAKALAHPGEPGRRHLESHLQRLETRPNEQTRRHLPMSLAVDEYGTCPFQVLFESASNANAELAQPS